MNIDLQTDPIFVAGHRGLVGSALVRRLEALGARNLILRQRSELDLTDQAAVRDFFRSERSKVVLLAAARVGGIHANDTWPADFIRDNLAIQTNVIDSAFNSGCEKFVFLGSSCIYPRDAPQPIRESYLLTGPLERTNEAYAIAKIAGIEMCKAYQRQYGWRAISLMPTNLYGPGDNFDLETSHVLPALLRKFQGAVESGASRVTVWGTGTPRREFLHVDDLADATIFLLERYDDSDIVNIGTGTDVSIRELAELIARVTGFQGEIEFDTSKPDGTPRKLLDVSRLNSLGWNARIPLETGIRGTLEWYLANRSENPDGVRGAAPASA